MENKLFLKKIEKCKKVIEMVKECEGLYRIKFIGKEYIAVRGCRYLYWIIILD